MASKISDLGAVTDVQDTDEFVLARAGTSKKIDGVDLRTELGGDTGDDVPVTNTQTGAAAPGLEFLDRPVTFNGVVDPKMELGYNPLSTVATEPRYIFVLEGDYYDAVNHWQEAYVEQNYPGGETLEDGTTPVTGGTTTSGSHSLPVATINVASTTAFPTEGKIVIGGAFHGENGQLVNYTGKTGTTFTGCTGGTGSITAGTRVSRFYNRPFYIQSLRDSGASYKNIIKFDLGVDGGNVNFAAGPNQNLFAFDETNGFAIATGYKLTQDGTPVARRTTNGMAAASLPNIRAWNYDLMHVNAGAGMGAAGDVMMCQVPWPDADTVASVCIYLSAGGTTLTASQCLAGIYDSSGTLLATTVDQSTAWASSGLKTCLLTAPTLIPAGTGANPCIYVAFFWNGSAQPSVYKGLNNPPLANGGNVAADKRFSRGATGRTTSLPSSITMSSRTDSTCSSFWAAVGV